MIRDGGLLLRPSSPHPAQALPGRRGCRYGGDGSTDDAKQQCLGNNNWWMLSEWSTKKGCAEAEPLHSARLDLQSFGEVRQRWTSSFGEVD